MDLRPKIPIVGDHEDVVGALGSGAHPGLVDELDEELVARSSAGMANDQARRDPLAAQSKLRWAIEDELDADGRRDRGTKPPDEGRRRQRCRAAPDRVEQVGAIDEDAIDALEGTPCGAGHRARW
jgi:hypothetical protein